MKKNCNKYHCNMWQVALTDHRQAGIMAQKHDNRINKAQELLLGRLSDMTGDAKKGESDIMAVTAHSTPSGTKSSTSSSPACWELSRTRSVEKFVYEMDKSQLPMTVNVQPVSSVLILTTELIFA